MKNEKSIEQIALEDYVWKGGTNKFFKVSNTTAFVLGGITYLSLVILNKGDIRFFLSLLPAMMIVAIVLVLSMPFSGVYRGKRKTRKIIANLSREEKKKITKDYINSEIQKWNKDIAYCEKQIQPLQKSIDHHKHEIEKLESELNNL